MLEGIQVLELGSGIAGGSAAAILGGLGASTSRRVPPDAGPAATLREPTLTDASGERFSILEALLERGKSNVGAPPNAEEFEAAQIVICDRVEDVAGLPSESGAYAALVARCNAGVWVTISPFGLTGPHAGYLGSELVSCAAGGLAATVAPREGGRPCLTPGWQGLLATGQIAALAALHGLDQRRARREPVHVDVSSQEAVVMVGALPECAHVMYRCPGRAGSGRYVAPSGLFPCRDGFVRIAAIDNHQWAGMVRAMGQPGWVAGLEDRPARAKHADRINREVEAWTLPQTKAACADLLQAEGVPSTPVNAPDELLTSPQFRARGFIERIQLRGIDTRAPGRPYTWSPTGATCRTPEDAAGLRDLRVAEFAHVLAGPIAGALLGAMGAHVVRFEDRARLDLYRRTGPFAEGVAGPERGAYFAVANHSKHSLAVDVEDDPEAARRLVDRSDVVLENFGSRRMTRMEVDADRCLERDPELLYVSVSGFGQSGPLADYRAYANNIHAYGGLSHLTRNEAGEREHVTSSLADPLSSLTAATLIAAWVLGRERAGGRIDLSMAEVMATRLAEFIAEAGADSARSLPAGSDRFPYAPHGIHPTRDERWLAIAVQCDAEWERLLEALDRPRTLQDPTWSKAATRWEQRRTIQAALDQITRQHDADALFHRLQGAGVRAAPVATGADLVEDPHLLARGFFPKIEHPDSSLEDARLVGLAWRFVGEGPIPLSPPPRLGSFQLPDHPA